MNSITQKSSVLVESSPQKEDQLLLQFEFLLPLKFPPSNIKQLKKTNCIGCKRRRAEKIAPSCPL
jgi:hypothetical protein